MEQFPLAGHCCILSGEEPFISKLPRAGHEDTLHSAAVNLLNGGECAA